MLTKQVETVCMILFFSNKVTFTAALQTDDDDQLTLKQLFTLSH